uniref:Uncharacterized protein n=1 Tax=Parascaris univalens TaxID=6257 RepID=A0A914ZYC6_PARUN
VLQSQIFLQGNANPFSCFFFFSPISSASERQKFFSHHFITSYERMADSFIDSGINICCKWEEIEKLNGQICDAIKKLDVKQWERLSFGIRQCAQGLNIRIEGRATGHRESQRNEKTQKCDRREEKKQESPLVKKIYSSERKEFIELINDGTQTTDIGQVVTFIDTGSIAWGPVKNKEGWCFRKVQIGSAAFTQT